MKNHKDLREFIVDKFGNLRLFLDAAGLPYSTTRKFMHRPDDDISENEQKRITAMYHLAENTNRKPDKTELRMNEIKAIRICIWALYGGTKPMSLLNKDWSESAASNLVNGRLKKRSPRVKELMWLLTEHKYSRYTEEIQNAVNILKQSIK